ncbi:MAG TPA: sulfite exporter TauE/SafE family protein [Phycisphaerae bacterium]|nr:sulfite exporter TauE/SafE family protein [Phycisphaerae bacterium]
MDWSAVGWIAAISAASFLGGVVGSISGLGGGIVIVPVLTIFFHIPIQQAIAISQVSIIAVSSGAGSVYVKEHITNVRAAMFLELATASGAIIGAALVSRYLSAQVLSLLFGLALLASLVPMVVRFGEELPQNVQSDWLARFLKLDGSYFDKGLGREVYYKVGRVPPAMVIMFIAGVLASLLGIGAGALKVLGLEMALRLPTRVATATSNFMIGVTAVAAAGIYLLRGNLVLPFVVAPSAIFVLLGAVIGTKIINRMTNSAIRKFFALLLGIIGIQMLLKGMNIQW